MSYHEMSASTYLSTIIKELLSQKEEDIMSSITNLVRLGVLLIQSGDPVIVQEQGIEPKYRLIQSFKLVVKDQEVLEALTKENALLRERISRIEAIMREKIDG